MSIQSGRSFILAAALLATATLPAHANAGTPLMWATAFHLVFGNLIIGLAEGVLLARVATAPYRRALLSMVVANYVSAWAGLAIVNEWRALRDVWLGTEPLYAGPHALVYLAVTTFGLTIAMEWPFCRWALGPRPGAWRRALLASVAVQTLSYAALVPYYCGVSRASLYSRVGVDPALTRPAEARAVIWYIGPDGDVYRVRSADRAPEKVVAAGLSDPMASLFFQKSKITGAADLLTDPERVLVRDAAAWDDGFTAYLANGKRAVDLVRPEVRVWEVKTGSWSMEGVMAEHRVRPDESLQVSVETPVLSWFSSNATVLPGDQVVYQLGPQVVLLDLRTRRIGLVALGRSPVVGLELPQR